MLRLLGILSIAIILVLGRGEPGAPEGDQPHGRLVAAPVIQIMTASANIPEDEDACPTADGCCASCPCCSSSAPIANLTYRDIALRPVGNSVRVLIRQENPPLSIPLKRDPPVPRQIG